MEQERNFFQSEMMAISGGVHFPAIVGSPSSWCSGRGSRLTGSITKCEMVADCQSVTLYVYMCVRGLA